MCVFECLPSCACAPHLCQMATGHWGQKRVSEPLKLQFKDIARHCGDAGNQTKVLYKSSKCSLLWSHLSSPWTVCLKILSREEHCEPWFFFTRVNSYKQNCWSKRTLTILTHSISHTPLRKGTWIHTPKSYQWWVSALTTIASIIWERGWLSNIWKMQALPFEGKCPSPCWRVMHIFSLVYCLCLSFVLFSIEGASSLAKFAELIYIFRIFPFTFKMPLIQCTLYRLTQADRPANQLFRIF